MKWQWNEGLTQQNRDCFHEDEGRRGSLRLYGNKVKRGFKVFLWVFLLLEHKTCWYSPSSKRVVLLRHSKAHTPGNKQPEKECSKKQGKSGDLNAKKHSRRKTHFSIFISRGETAHWYSYLLNKPTHFPNHDSSWISVKEENDLISLKYLQGVFHGCLNEEKGIRLISMW